MTATTDPLALRIDAELATHPDHLPMRLVVFDGHIECGALDAADPVLDLLGWRAPVGAIAVGLDAPATARRNDDTTAPDGGRVRHLQFRDGTSATFFRSDGLTLTTATATSGRVPDCCRRAFGLATAPPPATMTTFVTDAWLHVVARHALVGSVDWRRAVALHPGATGCDPLFRDPHVTPADLADNTRSLGQSLDWERFRVISASLGTVPMIELPMGSIEWMDSGMFARWALDDVTPRAASLELLAHCVTPDALDRIWATVMLIGDD